MSWISCQVLHTSNRRQSRRRRINWVKVLSTSLAEFSIFLAHHWAGRKGQWIVSPWQQQMGRVCPLSHVVAPWPATLYSWRDILFPLPSLGWHCQKDKAANVQRASAVYDCKPVKEHGVFCSQQTDTVLSCSSQSVTERSMKVLLRWEDTADRFPACLSWDPILSNWGLSIHQLKRVTYFLFCNCVIF